MDFQWATPIFHFATAHATPTRRSIEDRSVEISIPPTLAPSIPTFRMNLWMTRLTQRNQITPIMCATFTQRLLVVNLFHRNCKSTFKTQLTERMLRSILITYPLPCTTITAFGLLISNEFLIVTVYFLILSILVDTFISKISLPMQPVPEIGSISVA